MRRIVLILILSSVSVLAQRGAMDIRRAAGSGSGGEVTYSDLAATSNKFILNLSGSGTNLTVKGNGTVSTPLSVLPTPGSTNFAWAVFGTNQSSISSTQGVAVNSNVTQILVPDGLAGRPAIAHYSAPTVGWYYTAGPGVTFNTGSDEIFRLNNGTGLIGVKYGVGFGALVTSIDTVLTRDNPGSLAQRNGTSAQTNRVYKTFTDTSNYSLLESGYDGSKSAFFLRKTEAGTGISAAGIQISAHPNQVGTLINTNGSVIIGGELIVTNIVTYGLITIPWAGTTVVNFSNAPAFKDITVTNQLTLSATNFAPGRAIAIRLKPTNNATNYTITLDSSFQLYGSNLLTSSFILASNKNAIISLSSWGSTSADVAAAVKSQN